MSRSGPALRQRHSPYNGRHQTQTPPPASAPPNGSPCGTPSPRTAAVIGPKRHCRPRHCRPRVRRLGRRTAPSAPVQLPQPDPNVTAGLGSAGWAALRHPQPPHDCRDPAQTTPPVPDPPNGSPCGTLSPRTTAATRPKRHHRPHIRRMGRLTALSAPARLPRPGPNVPAGLKSAERAASRHTQHPYHCRNQAQMLPPVADPPNGPPYGTLSTSAAAATGPKRA